MAAENKSPELSHRALIRQLSAELKTLKASYERYFIGVDKREPLRDRENLKKRMRLLRNQATTNTATRFHAEQLVASFITHESHWNRIAKRIEEGTYRRAGMRNTAAAATTATAKTARSADNKGSPDRDQAIAQLHNDFSSAQQQAGLAPVSYEALQRTVEKQKAAIIAKYKCRDVQFRVAVKDGKPILKAVAKT